MTAQRKAAIWHWTDLGLAGAVFAFAAFGVWGHYHLRRQYQLSKPWEPGIVA